MFSSSFYFSIYDLPRTHYWLHGNYTALLAEENLQCLSVQTKSCYLTDQHPNWIDLSKKGRIPYPLFLRKGMKFSNFAFLPFEYILVLSCRKLFAYRNTLKSVPVTNQYWAISVKIIAQAYNGLPLTGFEPMGLAILRLLVWCLNHSITPSL